MDETLDQIETHEDLQTHIDKCMFKNINNKHEIRAYNQALDDFSGTLKKKSAYKDGELKKDNKAQLAHLVWGLNRLALEKLFPVGYIAPSYVFGAHPYVQSPRQNAPEKADDA